MKRCRPVSPLRRRAADKQPRRALLYAPAMRSARSRRDQPSRSPAILGSHERRAHRAITPGALSVSSQNAAQINGKFVRLTHEQTNFLIEFLLLRPMDSIHEQSYYCRVPMQEKSPENPCRFPENPRAKTRALRVRIVSRILDIRSKIDKRRILL